MRHRTRGIVIVPLLVGVVATAVYWLTAYPTITWWDSSNYSLAAVTLGLTSSPGSLLLTLLGWLVTRVPSPLPAAHTLNLLAGLLAATAAALVVVVAVRIHRLLSRPGSPTSGLVPAGAAIGALAFAFSVTLWEHAIKFTPYVLTVVFTVLILLTLVRWWEVADQPDAWRWLLLLTFLFGLDFSVHRTNALLIPGAIAWILVRRWRTFGDPRAWLGAVGGMAAGLSFQLLVMPISANTTSPLNMFQPDTWARFWDYVSLAQTGGNFQLDLLQRKSPFWSNQVADLLRAFIANFAHTASAAGLAGWLPVLAAIAGVVEMWRRSKRFCSAFLLLLLLQAVATVIYFNIPAEYFRSLDRHYLPVLTTVAVAVSVGTVAGVRLLAALWGRTRVLAAAGGVVVLFIPLVQLLGNWSANDASRRYFTRDFAANALLGLPQDAFYFTVGDNDTFPVMYLQAVEGVRPDVRIVNLSLANTAWYIDQLRSRYPNFPVKGTPDERRAANAATWKDSTLVVRRTGPEDVGVMSGPPVLDSIEFHPVPSFGLNEPPASDEVFLDIVRESAFRTPVTVARTAGNSGLSWLSPYARDDGMHFRVVPVKNPVPDPEVLRANLLGQNEYRGYADSTVVLDDVTKTMGRLYRDAFTTLLKAEVATGNITGCLAIAARFNAMVPPSRVATPRADAPRLEVCGF